MNLFEARLGRHGGALVCEVGDQRLALAPDALDNAGDLEHHLGDTIGLGVRPEHIEDAAVTPDAPADRRLRGTVRSVEALGSELLAHIEIPAHPVLTDEVKEVAADLDASVVKDLEAEVRENKTPVVGRFDVTSRARPGQPVEIVVDTRKLHFFDLKTGRAFGARTTVLAG
jgi:multiple sugar transport system ATP-binding protein